MDIQYTDHSTMKSARETVVENFRRTFGNATLVPALPITSGADPSVHLVGSSISTLKPWLGSAIPTRGVIALQPSVRTQNLTTLGDGVTQFRWGAHFTNFSLIHPIDTTVGLAERTLGYFLDECGFAPEDVLIRATRAHAGLARLAELCGRQVRVEWDAHDPSYYKHKIGMRAVIGDNFNVALRHPVTGQCDDVGNYIHFSDGGLGDLHDDFVEVGFGDTTILRAKLGLDHVLDAFAFPSPLLKEKWEERHFEDALLTGLVLWSEGLRPSNKDGRTKLLRRYVEAGRRICTRNALAADDVTVWLEELARNEGLSFSSARTFGARLVGR